jgi:TIGR00252 family protein
MSLKKDIGRQGEQIAKEYLQKKGYQILDTNWYNHHCELDIVAKDGEELVIVEVKTRTTSIFGDPSDAVNTKKMRRMINTADSYIRRHNLNNETRFDIISIIYEKKTYQIEHIKDAFYPTL